MKQLITFNASGSSRLTAKIAALSETSHREISVVVFIASITNLTMLKLVDDVVVKLIINGVLPSLSFKTSAHLLNKSILLDFWNKKKT